MAHACNLSTWKAEAHPGQPGLKEKPYLKKKKKKVGCSNKIFYISNTIPFFFPLDFIYLMCECSVCMHTCMPEEAIRFQLWL